jgi:phosphoribosylamine--glycine ligase
VVEEYLDGPEVSLFVVTDGTTALPLLPAQDFKRLGDRDEGPNTGGMGAYAPLSWLPESFVGDVMSSVVEPTLKEMARRGTPFAGLLYVGLALTAVGPQVVEFNARFGDPETEVVLPLLETALGELLLLAATGRLAEQERLQWSDGSACTVVVAAAGYPGQVRSGDRIDGLVDAGQVEGVTVLHAGTKVAGDGVVSAGGRVLAVTAVGEDLDEARDRAYQAVDLIRLDGSHHRHDIAAWAAELSRSYGLTDLR